MRHRRRQFWRRAEGSYAGLVALTSLRPSWASLTHALWNWKYQRPLARFRSLSGSPLPLFPFSHPPHPPACVGVSARSISDSECHKKWKVGGCDGTGREMQVALHQPTASHSFVSLSSESRRSLLFRSRVSRCERTARETTYEDCRRVGRQFL